ncbi:MAG TPA: hypothetical protein VKR24_01450 [Candidatus Limnocylindrales bacterium]|nr:hypothetical protein [Candidatus Limnocylindrales bacterium]
MHIEIDDWFGALTLLAVIVVVLFLVVFAAVRLALSDLGSRPEFSCETGAGGDLTRFVVTNVGAAPAFDVAVRSVRDAYGQPFARTTLLAPQASLTWAVPAGSTPVESPTRLGTVDWLSVEWRPRPDGPGRWNRVPVRLAQA